MLRGENSELIVGGSNDAKEVAGFVVHSYRCNLFFVSHFAEGYVLVYKCL